MARKTARWLAASFTLIAAMLAAGQAAQAQTAPQTSVVTPALPVAGTHTCETYYPEDAQRRSEAGDVLIGYDVQADGTINHVVVLKTSGFTDLDSAAVRCVTQSWRDTAATRDGLAVASPNHRAIIQYRLPHPQSPPRAAPRLAADDTSSANDTPFADTTDILLLAVGVLIALGLVVFLFRRSLFGTRD